MALRAVSSPRPPADGRASARAAGLRWVSTDSPGLRRVRQGKGFRYLDQAGRTVRDPDTLARIKRLAIPPAWTDVWICPDPDGHLQASGRDARGRKQFRYHPRWSEHRDRLKHSRVRDFGQALPTLRQRVTRDLRCGCLCREAVLAAIVTCLDRGQLRVGCEEYARQNGSAGACTLQDDHVRITGATVRFRFTGKGGVRRDIVIEHRELARVVARCRAVRGKRLFQYVDERGRRHAVTAREVNEYLRGLTRGRFSAKDFRTWHASLLCARLLPREPAPTERLRKRQLNEVVAQVASQLGNTPAVCRRSYIDPTLIERFLDA